MNKTEGKYTFTHFSDPAHGWLRVRLSLVKRLGILPQITPYSYIKGQTLYLEEDMDMTLFLSTFKAKMGYEPTIIEKGYEYGGPSTIRSYDHFMGVK